MEKVISLGEILLRLSPPMYQTLSQATTLDCQFGGSELNVLSTLAQLGYPVSLISAIPDNELGQMTEGFLFRNQIHQDYILKRGERLGIYYYQKGFSLRPSQVTYDRKYSAFYNTKCEDYDFNHVFDDMGWFHVSGITPALNENLYELTYYLMVEARKRGIPISFDLNYRASLWESFEEARIKLSELVKLANVCIGLEPLRLLTDGGVDLKDQLALKPPYDRQDDLEFVLSELANTYDLEQIAFTQREMSYNNEYQLKAYLYDGNTLYQTEKESIRVLDRVGTGDAFTAGIIYGLLEKKEISEVLAIGMASFKFKHTIEGDINIISKHDIEQMMGRHSHEIKR